MNYGRRFVTLQVTGIKIIPKKKKCKKAKWLSEEALQTAVKRREVKNTSLVKNTKVKWQDTPI